MSVVSPPPGGGVSNSLAFDVQYGTPTLDKMFPDATVEGGPKFTLTLIGSGFGPDSQVQWNGGPKLTQFVSGTEITAKIAATDISTVGTAAVAVLNPAPGTRSNPATFAINPTTSNAVAFQIGPDHSGDMNFDPVSFPTQSVWTATVNGQPSYALIADGKVFVTVEVGGNSQLLALDQETGAVVWGPISLSGAANAAYDAGSVFVVSGDTGTADVMQAYDAATGSLEWTTQLSGQYVFSSGPTARGGFVYTGGAGSGGTLYALDETNGAIAWTQPVANGDDSTPAVTADGIYVTYPCQTYDFRPGTAEIVGHDNSGCDGGGGATPVTANGTLYAPNGTGDYNGDEFDAETGQLTGTYTADIPPAIANDDGYFLQSGTLNAIQLSNNTIIWSFTGDGNLVTSPIVVNQYVIVGSSSGNLYALDAATGEQVWEINVGATIPPGPGWGAGMPLSGLAAGHGLLIVPAGDSVIAYRLASD
ncbi:MAG: PQQ-binding-like beta-propeller repeat protein [Ktedonobacteraceae bacterium]